MTYDGDDDLFDEEFDFVDEEDDGLEDDDSSGDSDSEIEAEAEADSEVEGKEKKPAAKKKSRPAKAKRGGKRKPKAEVSDEPTDEPADESTTVSSSKADEESKTEPEEAPEPSTNLVISLGPFRGNSLAKTPKRSPSSTTVLQVPTVVRPLPPAKTKSMRFRSRRFPKPQTADHCDPHIRRILYWSCYWSCCWSCSWRFPNSKKFLPQRAQRIPCFSHSDSSVLLTVGFLIFAYGLTASLCSLWLSFSICYLLILLTLQPSGVTCRFATAMRAVGLTDTGATKKVSPWPNACVAPQHRVR